MTPSTLKARLKEEGGRLGLAQVGVARPGTSEHGAFFRRWLAEGFAGGMGYLAREESLVRRMEPTRSLPEARSVIVVADHYDPIDAPGVPDDPSRAVVARYARGRDYHQVLLNKLEELRDWLTSQSGQEGHRCYVDTGPLLERELARRAGLGWFGRNTMLIHPRRGSYFFLGVLLTSVDLEPDPPFEADHCGSCTACLDACPTGALLGRDDRGAPVMDARLCISYLTIENRGSIPEALRPPMGNRVFGCDICQEVCPWTGKFAAEQEGDPEYRARAWPADRAGTLPLPDLRGPKLVDFTRRILAMSGKEYRRVFRDSPLSRPGRKGMLRNLCVALGNWGEAEALPVLAEAARDPSALVREHAVWAVGRIGKG